MCLLESAMFSAVDGQRENLSGSCALIGLEGNTQPRAPAKLVLLALLTASWCSQRLNVRPSSQPFQDQPDHLFHAGHL